MTAPDFSKIWAENTPLTPYVFNDSDYLEGWEFLGEIPPDRRMFDTWQKQADTKMLWLKNNILGYLLRQNSTEYQAGDIAFSPSLPSYLVLLCSEGGTTAATEPDFSEAEEDETVTDGTVVWTYKNLLSGDGAGDAVGTIKMYAGTGLQEGWLDCDGSAVSRTMYPDLFAAIGTIWGAGDGSTTFNLPRSEDLLFQGASTTNPVGTYKTAGLPNIEGEINFDWQEEGVTYSGAFADTTQSGSRRIAGNGGTGVFGVKASLLKFDASDSNSIYGNSDTVQPPAACVRFMIKAFDGQTPDSALIDITQYAADLANKATRSLDNLTQTGEDHFLEQDFTIIYPNGGTEANPANVASASRYIESNPFPSYCVNCAVEVLYNGEWGWYGQCTNNSYHHQAVASQLDDGNIVLQTCGDDYAWPSDYTASPFNGNPKFPLPCRIKVWKVGVAP